MGIGLVAVACEEVECEEVSREKKWTVEEKEISESSRIGEIRRGRRIQQPDQDTIASSKPVPV